MGLFILFCILWLIISALILFVEFIVNGFFTLVPEIVIAWGVAMAIVLAKQFSTGVASDSSSSIDGEHTSGPANHLLNGVYDGGRLYLYPTYMLFRPHAINLHHSDYIINYSDIADVVDGPMTLLFVITKQGNKEKFVVYHKDRWIQEIKRRMN